MSPAGWLLLFPSLAGMAAHAGLLLRSWWLLRWMQPFPARQPAPADGLLFSVIVPARNEAATIGACLRALLAQRFPAACYEILVVDDDSEDATAAIVQGVQHEAADAPVIRLLRVPPAATNAHKKRAIATGIAAARAPLVALTDADCRPRPGWLAHLYGAFDAQVAAVAGPVALCSNGRWLQDFQALESRGLVALAAAALGRGRPTLVNGGNLAYRKEAFEAVGGFRGLEHVASGDDELLLHRFHAAGVGELRYQVAAGALAETDAEPDWSALRWQRLRWVSKARAYDNPPMQRQQLAAYIGFAGYPLALGWALIEPAAWSVLAGLLLLRGLPELALLCEATRRWGGRRLLRRYPLQLLAYIPYVLWVGPAGALVKRYEWKGRRVR